MPISVSRGLAAVMLAACAATGAFAAQPDTTRSVKITRVEAAPSLDD